MKNYTDGRWHASLRVGPDLQRYEPFSKILSLGVFRFMPVEAREGREGMTPKRNVDYRGFIFTMRFFWPFHVEQWT